MIEADMSRAKALLRKLSSEGERITYTHVLVKAVALALAKHPDIHQLVAGSRRVYPADVDVCLSVSGDTALSPVLVVRGAQAKSLGTIADEVRTGAPKAVEKDREFYRLLNRWGWMLPFGFLRRFLIKTLLRRLSFRRAGTGTFHISSLPSVELCVPLLFNTSAILGVGQVKDRLIVQDSQPVVRPTVKLVCCVDHRVWNGMDASKFLNALKETLESGNLEQYRATAVRAATA